jgi:hypothetical protein
MNLGVAQLKLHLHVRFFKNAKKNRTKNRTAVVQSSVVNQEKVSE